MIDNILTVIKTYNRHIVLSISIIIAGIFFTQGINHNNNESVSRDITIMLVSLMVGIGYFMLSYLQNIFHANFLLISTIFSIILLIIMFIFTSVIVSKEALVMFAFFTVAALTLIIILGLAIFFYIFSNYLKSLTGWAGFLVNFIFYIPCLLLSFVQFIVNEFKITTNPVIILFCLEILLLLVYVYIPKIVNYISSKDGVPILEDSIALSSPNTFSLHKYTIMPDMDIQPNGNENETQRQSYALSMWTYVNMHGANKMAYNSETPIFDYGEGKPKITYYTGDSQEATRDVYRIYFTNNVKSTRDTNPANDFKSYYEVKLPPQRWNNLVFNYSSTHADLFINGHLERTFTFKNSTMPKLNASDVITTGSQDGLHGAISNIRYYPKTLSRHKITSMYTIFMKKSPPIINL